MSSRRWTLLAALFWTACGSSSDSSTGAGGGGQAGGGAGGSGGSGGGAPGCLDLWTDGVTEPDADGPDTQIHGTSAFDGEHLWVAWSRPDGGSNFDNWVAAYRCDGTRVIGPIEVTQSDANELDPTLAVSGDRLLVAWTSDDGSGAENLDLRYRVLGLDGSFVTDAIDLSAMRQGVAVTGNALGPSLAANDEGWMLAGSWGHADAPAFQAFAVQIDRDGAVVGEAQDAELDSMAGQTEVAVAVDDMGTHLAWQEDTTTSLAPTAHAVTLGQASTMLDDPGARPTVAPGPWMAWDRDGADVVVRPPSGADVALGLAGFNAFPSLAVAKGQAAISWMERVTGVRFRIHVAALDSSGALGPRRTLSTEGAPSVYPVDLTLIDPTHAVVVYQDGTSPSFRLKAEWVTLE